MNFQKIDLQKEIEELKNLSGEERGEDIKYLISYIKKIKGKEGFNKVETELGKLGYKLPDINKISNMEWIPVSLPNIFLVACVKVFNFEKKDILKMGKNAFSFKSIFKFYIRYFSSFKKTMIKATSKWNSHYSFGEIEIVKYDDKKKIFVIRLKNFKVHKFTYIYFQGLFSEIIRVALGNKKIKSEYAFNENSYHEYTFRWD